MTGYIAAGRSVEQALSLAERSCDACLSSASNLFDACTQYVKADGLENQHLSASMELFCAAVFGLVARGDDPSKALRTAGISRYHMIRSANENVLTAIDSTIKHNIKPMGSTLAAFRDERQNAGQLEAKRPKGHDPIL